MRAGNCLAWDLIKCIFHIKVGYAKNFVFYEEKHEIILYCPCGHAGIFCGADTGILKQRYIHVAIAPDAELKETYSVGRRNPAIPILAGFERRIRRAFYRICELECTEKQGITDAMY